MVKAKRYNEIDLSDFYVVSPVFKRYSQFNLWSENFSEYNHIKYCEMYLSQYFFGQTQKYLLENFSEAFLLTLYNSQRFLKFIKSGFFKYINFHFLLLFQNNRFFFFGDSFKEVEIFVEEYFQRYIQNFFEQDLLTCIVSCINELVPNSFREYLNNRFKFIYKELLIVESNTRSLSNSVVILNLKGSDKKYYSLGFSNYNLTIKNFYFERSNVKIYLKIKSFYYYLTGFLSKIYKSLDSVTKVPEVLTPTFLLEDTIYCWGHCRNNTYKTVFSKNFLYSLFDLSKTSTGYKYLTFNREIKSSLSLLALQKWCFYVFSKCIYKSFNIVSLHSGKKESNNVNHDFYFLLESSRILINFDKKRNDMGIYRDSVDVFFEDIKSISRKLDDTTIMRFSKSFECTFNKFFAKFYLERGVGILTACKKVFKNLESSPEITFEAKSLVHFFEENCDEFCLNIEDIFNSKFKNSYTNLKRIKKNSSNTSKILFANKLNIFKAFYQCFEEEFTITPLNNLSNSNKIKVKHFWIDYSFSQSKKIFNKRTKNFSNRWGLYAHKNFLNVNKSLFVFHSNLSSYKYLFSYNYIYIFSDRFYTIKMTLLYNFCFFSSGLCNQKFKIEFWKYVPSKENKISFESHGNFLLKNTKHDWPDLTEEVNAICGNTKKICSKKTIFEVSDYEDDEDVLEEFIVDLFSK
uniref:Uncharacterized protein n=1 Tax=Pterygophora californica TaxID=169782 RepID=A0A8F0FCT1_9PHAE|nr:hypothetical protein [Pterygophora californica]